MSSTSSSTSSNSNLLSSVQFLEIFEEALVQEYRKKTEKDIKLDPLFAKIQDCKSSDAVLKVLEEQALAFEKYRKGWKDKLVGRLEPIVDILSRLFIKFDLEGIIVSVRLMRYSCCLREFIIYLADISTSEGYIYWNWSPA